MSGLLGASVRSAVPSSELWRIARGLDFSFVSPKIVSVLDEPASIASISDKKELDKARTALSFESSWIKPNTVRSVEMDSIANGGPSLQPSNNTLEDCFIFPFKAKLLAFDDTTRSLTYELLDPSHINIPSPIASSISSSAAVSNFSSVSPVKLPKIFTLTIRDVEPLSSSPSSVSSIDWVVSSDLPVDAPEEANADPSVFIPSGIALNDLDTAFARKWCEFLARELDYTASGKASVYPLSQRRAVADTFFGTRVLDPFRWLEDPDSEQTVHWVDSQNKLTNSVLDTCPDRERILAKLPEMYSYERYSSPFRRGQYYYYSHNDGLQNQSVYFQTSDLKEPGRVFLDPATLDADGLAAVSILSFSPDGRKVAIGVQRKGSDWSEVFVRDTVTLQDASTDHLRWIKFSGISWKIDGSGFFYSRYPAPASLISAKDKSAGTETDSTHFQTLYYHQIGTAQDEDVEVYSTPEDASNFVSGAVTDDGAYLLVTLSNSCDDVNRLYVARLPESDKSDFSNLQFARVVDNLDASYSFITSYVDTFFAQSRIGKPVDTIAGNTSGLALFVSNLDAPRSRVVCLNLDKATDSSNAIFHTNKDKKESTRRAVDLDETVLPTDEKLTRAISRAPEFHVILPEHPTGVLSSVLNIGGYLVVQHNIDVTDSLSVYTLHSSSPSSSISSVNVKKVDFDLSIIPLNSSLSISGKSNHLELFVGATSMIHPGASFVVTLPLLSTSPLETTGQVFKSSAPKGFVSEEYEVHQRFFTSKDGTRIPLFMSHKKGLKLDGNAPVYLYGYGGFNISLGPSFSVNRWLWMHHFDGVAVVVNLRGGGEFGEDWHAQGVGLKKQNVFDDFQAAAEYLIHEGYTIPQKIAIHGGSNGGLLVAACANQRPDLFGAAVAAVGVQDMLRFHKFTVGFAWCSDYGCSEESKEHFENLHRISPVHNVRIPSKIDEKRGMGLPPIMVTTSDHDDRVAPLHSLKYVAMAQTRLGRLEKHACLENPILARVETKAGHGAGKPLSKIMAEHADVFGFFAKYTGAKWIE